MIDWNSFNEDMKYIGMEIPRHTQKELENYLFRGYCPGGFLESMLAHHYDRAFATADVANRQTIWAIWRWITMWAPPDCHGSYDAIKQWREDLLGRRSQWAQQAEKKAIWQNLTTIA